LCSFRNSGGPLLDSNGKLIGMNTAIYSPSGASAGIGFAIPVDQVKSIVETLIRDGRVVRPVLGISYLGSKQARTLGITKGVLVLEVPPDSPAFVAGLKGTRRTYNGLIGTLFGSLIVPWIVAGRRRLTLSPLLSQCIISLELGDIITKVNDRVIEKEADLFMALEALKPGDVVDVTVNRVVAVSDEIQVKEVIISIALLPSTQFEKQFLLLPQ
jgi:S1-C subfamily serine protease